MAERGRFEIVQASSVGSTETIPVGKIESVKGIGEGACGSVSVGCVTPTAQPFRAESGREEIERLLAEALAMFRENDDAEALLRAVEAIRMRLSPTGDD